MLKVYNRPIARDVIIKITGNIRKSGSHVGVPLIRASTFYMAMSANIVPLVLKYLLGRTKQGLFYESNSHRTLTYCISNQSWPALTGAAMVIS